MRTLFYFLVLSLLLPLNAAAKSKSTKAQFGARSYEIEMPDGDKVQPYSVVFVLHGGGGSGKTLRKHYNFHKLAGGDEVVLVYPDGLEGHWNDGRAGGRSIFKNKAPDDVAFLSDLAKDLVKRRIAKPDKIYVTGVSNGGLMTQRLLCEASETFAAGAVVIAGLPANLKNCMPSQARPILLINADADPLMPWAGGGIGFRKGRGLVLSGMDTFSHWQGVNGCTEKYETLKMPDSYLRDETRAVKYIGICEQPTEMIRIKNGGHNIPMFKSGYRTGSKKYKRRKKILGRYNHDFDCRDEIWEFFKRAGL